MPGLAIQDFDQAIALDSQDPTAYTNRSLAYFHLNMDPQGQQDVERALALGADASVLDRQVQEVLSQR